jgi:hypothetical protein
MHPRFTSFKLMHPRSTSLKHTHPRLHHTQAHAPEFHFVQAHAPAPSLHSSSRTRFSLYSSLRTTLKLTHPTFLSFKLMHPHLHFIQVHPPQSPHLSSCISLTRNIQAITIGTTHPCSHPTRRIQLTCTPSPSSHMQNTTLAHPQPIHSLTHFRFRTISAHVHSHKHSA